MSIEGLFSSICIRLIGFRRNRMRMQIFCSRIRQTARKPLKSKVPHKFYYMTQVFVIYGSAKYVVGIVIHIAAMKCSLILLPVHFARA